MAKDDEMGMIRATRILAMWSASRPQGKEDPEFQVREIQRWYSHRFNYKLHEVEDIPFETVAMHYFEHHYAQMSPEEREEEIKLLVLSQEEKEAEKKSDDDFLKSIQDKSLTGSLQAATKELKAATDALKPKEATSSETVEQLREASKMPEIDMQFVSPEEMEDMGEWDLFGPPKDDKK